MTDRSIFTSSDPAAYRSAAFREAAGRLVRPAVRAAISQIVGRRFRHVRCDELELHVDRTLDEIFEKLHVARLAARLSSQSRFEMFMAFSLLHARTSAIELMRRSPRRASPSGVTASQVPQLDVELLHLRLIQGKSWREIEEHFRHTHSRMYLRVRFARLVGVLVMAAQARE